MARKKQSLGDLLRERIAARLDEGDMTLKGLAMAARMQQPRLWQFVNDKTDIRLSNVERLIDVLGLEVVERNGGG